MSADLSAGSVSPSALLRIDGLDVGIDDAVHGPLTAIEALSLGIARGETLALVGESAAARASLR